MAQDRQKYYYYRTARHRPDFKPGDPVLFRRGNNWELATITQKLPEPRSYSLDNGLRRTSFHLRARPTPANMEQEFPSERQPNHSEEDFNGQETSEPSPSEEKNAEDEAPDQGNQLEQESQLRRSTRPKRTPDWYGMRTC